MFCVFGVFRGSKCPLGFCEFVYWGKILTPTQLEPYLRSCRKPVGFDQFDDLFHLLPARLKLRVPVWQKIFVKSLPFCAGYLAQLLSSNPISDQRLFQFSFQ
jgi:hypothetical protein